MIPGAPRALRIIALFLCTTAVVVLAALGYCVTRCTDLGCH